MNKNDLQLNDKLLGLLKALVGIIIVFFIIFLFAYLLPVIFRIVDDTEINFLEKTFERFVEGIEAILGGLLWLVFGVIAVVLAIWFFIVLIPIIFKFSTWKQVRNGDKPLDTLKMRYAKGELSKEQYLDMKKTIEDG